MRTCRVCQKSEPKVVFKKKANICVGCNTQYMKEYRRRNWTKIRQQISDWKNTNRIAHRASCRAYHATPKGKTMHVARVQKTPRTWLSHLFSRLKGKCLRPGPHDPKGPEPRRFEIDLDFVIGIYGSQQGRCALTAIEMVHKFNNPCSISIDRIDSTKGYIPGNVQLVCQWVNRAKNNYSNEQFKAILDAYFQARLAAKL